MSCWGELGFPGIFAAEDFIHRPPFHYIFICRHLLEQIWVEIAERQGWNFCCILSSARAYLVLCYFGASLIKISIKWIEKYMRVVYTHMFLFVCANMCGGQCSVFFFFLTQSLSLDFTNKRLRAIYWGESLLAQRDAENTQLIFLLSGHPRTPPPTYHLPQTKMFLSFPFYSSLCLCSWFPLTLYAFLFIIILYSLPVNFLLASPLDLCLI